MIHFMFQLYKTTFIDWIFFLVECWSRAPDQKDVKIEVGWVFRITECGNEYEGHNQA